jgi:hypothetical protein
VLTDVGAVDLQVPSDRPGTFEPQIVRMGQTRLAGFNEGPDPDLMIATITLHRRSDAPA